jgi:uncharacterized protein YjbI with pentapeptide repeats
MKFLAAFVRTHAKAEPFCPRDKASKPPEDIQAAVSVLARREPQLDGPGGIDLTHTCLTGARLFKANFRGADFNYAVLYNADLAHADLSDARLFRADLREVSLNYARLYGVDRTNTDLRGADLSNVVGLNRPPLCGNLHTRLLLERLAPHLKSPATETLQAPQFHVPTHVRSLRSAPLNMSRSSLLLARTSMYRSIS